LYEIVVNPAPNSGLSKAGNLTVSLKILKCAFDWPWLPQ